eukprot:g283.t1
MIRGGAIQNGQRVRVRGKEAVHDGVCRFFGTTLFREGVWVGVELDLPNGKNDGSVSGTRYFSCPHRYGLFARAEVVEVLQDRLTSGQRSPQARQYRPAASPSSPAQEAVLGRTLKVETSVFEFEKVRNEWTELCSEQVSLFVGKVGGGQRPLIRLRSVRNPNTPVNHYIELDTKLEPNVGSDRAWVFRAKNMKTKIGSVLALQFVTPKDAMMFSSQYAICSQVVREENRRSAGANEGANRQNETYMTPKAPSANGSVAPPPPPEPPAEELQRAIVEKANGKKTSPSVSQQRRRLSIAGSDTNMDGRRNSTMPAPAAQSKVKSPSPPGGAVKGTVVRSYVGMSKKGYAPYNIKKENQDSCFMHEDPKTESLMLGVFDGHGEHGHHVSRFMEIKLPPAVLMHPSWATSPKTAISEMLVAEEKKILKSRQINTSLSGTTAVVAAIRGSALTVANIGDSRLIIALRGEDGTTLKPYSVTEDHKPDTPKEQARIERSGGRVWAMTYEDGVAGPARVWLKNQDLPGLAMSRSIGDEVAKRAGVVSTPEMFEYEIPPQTEFLCMATDGLWEFMSNQDVVQIIQRAKGNGRLAVENLMAESERRWKKEEPVVDDTTIVLAYFDFSS